MSFFLHHLLRHGYDMFWSHFLIFWLLILVAIAVCGWYLAGSTDAARPAPAQGPLTALPKPSPSLADITAGMVLIGFLALYTYIAFYKEDFAHYDNDNLIDFSLRGVNFPVAVWPYIGRFLPLQYQEWNLIRFITRSCTGYTVFSMAQVAILVAALWIILDEYKFRYRVAILISAMLVPSFVVSNASLVCPERNVLFWLTIILLCLYRYSRTRARKYFVGSLVATHFALYYKETVVVVVLAYVVARLLVEGYTSWRVGQRSWQQFARQNSLTLGLLAVSGIYLVLFGLAMLPQHRFSYINDNQAPLASVFLRYLQTAWLPFLVIPVLILRFSRFALGKGQFDDLWDCLAVGATACFLSLLALRMYGGYYTAPADLIALLYLARVSLSWLSKPTRFRVALVAAAFMCVLVHNAAYSTFAVIETKSTVAMKRELSEFLRTYSPSVSGRGLTLYFPYADGFSVMGFCAYLSYKGFQVPMEGLTAPQTGPTLAVEGAATFANNRCVWYRNYACAHVESPREGALIIVLPDDRVSEADVAGIGRHAHLLLSAEAPVLRSRIGPWLKLLTAISPRFSNSGLPGHWLQLHVFKLGPFHLPTVAPSYKG